MKRLLAGMAVISLLAVGALAFADGPGGWRGGHMTGAGYGGHMMSGQSAEQVMGRSGPGFKHDQKFLDETADLRKALHNKRFEYFEARRDPETTAESIAELEKEMREIQEKMHEKSPRTVYGSLGGHGRCW